jgi:hypothetical protein
VIKPEMTPEEAAELIKTLIDPAFLEVACLVCGKAAKDHSGEEAKECNRRLRAGDYEDRDEHRFR